MFCWRAAADPEQAVEVNADGCGGFGMESVGDIDPGADAACIRETGNEGKRERGAARAFRSGEFGDGPDGEAAAECVIECEDASGRGRTNDARRWGERGRNAVGKRSLDLEAEQVGRRHRGTSSPYIRLPGGARARGICTAG